MSDDMTRLVESLRLHAFDDCNETVIPTHLCNIAADAIEAQAAEIERLREALDAIRHKDRVSFEYLSPLSQATGDRHLRQATRDGPCGKIARATIKETKP